MPAALAFVFIALQSARNDLRVLRAASAV